MTERRYVIAEVILFFGQMINVIEVEKEAKAISTFIYICEDKKNVANFLKQIMSNLIYTNGVWYKKALNNMNFFTLRHGKKNITHRAKLILSKINQSR